MPSALPFIMLPYPDLLRSLSSHSLSCPITLTAPTYSSSSCPYQSLPTSSPATLSRVNLPRPVPSPTITITLSAPQPRPMPLPPAHTNLFLHPPLPQTCFPLFHPMQQRPSPCPGPPHQLQASSTPSHPILPHAHPSSPFSNLFHTITPRPAPTPPLPPYFLRPIYPPPQSSLGPFTSLWTPRFTLYLILLIEGSLSSFFTRHHYSQADETMFLRLTLLG